MKLSIAWKSCTRVGRWPLKRAERLVAASCLLCLVLFITSDLSASGDLNEVYELLEAGETREARSLLQGIVANEYANAERLALLALLSDNVDSSYARYFRTLDLNPDQETAGRALLGLLNFALAAEQPQLGLELINRYRNRCERGNFYPQILIVWSQMLMPQGDFAAVRGDLEKALLREDDSETAARLLLALGNVEMLRGDYVRARGYLRRLANRSGQRYAGLALLRLTESYIREGDYDNAQFTYRVLSSRYPQTVGIDQLRERF